MDARQSLSPVVYGKLDCNLFEIARPSIVPGSSGFSTNSEIERSSLTRISPRPRYLAGWQGLGRDRYLRTGFDVLSYQFVEIHTIKLVTGENQQVIETNIH